MPDYAKDIEQAKQKAIDALNSNVDEMGSTAYDILLQEIENIFDIKAGKIVADKDFIKKLNQLTISVIDILQSTPKFSGHVSAFIKRMDNISNAITSFQENINGIVVPDFELPKKIVIDETIDQFLGNGLNQNFVQPLRDLIYQNASPGGLSMTQARAKIKEYILGNKDKSGKLDKYIEQTSIQAVSSYAGMINKKLMEQFDYDGLLQTGSLIDTSSPQCKYVHNELNGILPRNKWEEFEKIAKKNGLIPGTTFDTLPLNLAHIGCRHGWYPIIIKSLQKAA